MQTVIFHLRMRLDQLGLMLSALCLAHCVLGLMIVAGLGFGMGGLLHPAIHEIGLLLAALVAVLAIGIGLFRHRRPLPVLFAVGGLAFMAWALAAGHGAGEAVLTLIGLLLVGAAHLLNLRQA